MDDKIKIKDLNPISQNDFKESAEFPITQDGETYKASISQVIQKVSDNQDDKYFKKTDKIPNENLTFGEVKERDKNVVSGDSVYNYALTDSDVGIIDIKKGENIIQELADSDKSNSELWGKGHFTTNGSIVDTDISLYSKKKYPIAKGNYEFNIVIDSGGNRRCIITDGKGEIIQIIANTNPSGYIFDVEITDDRARYVQISQIERYSNKSIYIKPKQDIKRVTDDVFLTEDGAKLENKTSEIVEEKLSDFGFKVIKKGTNIFSELNDKPQVDGDYFGKGYLVSDGTVDAQGRRWHTKKYYEVVEGEKYEFLLFFSGNDNLVVYDKDYKPILFVKNKPGSTATFKDEITIPKGGKHVRTSIIDGQQYVNRMYFRNVNDIVINPSSSGGGVSLEGIKNVLKLQNTPKNNFPIVSFVSDDCAIENEWYIDILNEKEIKSTFAVITGWFDDDDKKDLFFTKKRLKELYDDGHDLAGHTNSHERLATMTIEQVESELYNNKRILSTIAPKNNVFIAPYGSRNTEVDKVIRKYFDCDIRTAFRLESETLEGASNTPPINTYLLKRFSFDVQKNNVSIIEKAKEAVNIAIQDNGWLIFAIHPQYAEYRSDIGGSTMRRNELKELIDYIKGLDVPIMTATQALDVFKNPVQLGNKDMDSTYWELGMNGSERGDLI